MDNLHINLFNEGYREYEWEYDAPYYLENGGPYLSGTNRRECKEYRLGKLEHKPAPVLPHLQAQVSILEESPAPKLIWFSKLYWLDSRVTLVPHRASMKRPKIWGISMYKLEDEDTALDQLPYMVGPDHYPAGYINRNRLWKPPVGFVEFKVWFWSKDEAMQAFEAINSQARLREHHKMPWLGEGEDPRKPLPLWTDPSKKYIDPVPLPVEDPVLQQSILIDKDSQ